MGNEELISEYIDRDGIARDTKYMVDHLNQVKAVYQELGSIRIGITGTDSLAKIIPATKEAQAATDAYNKSLKNLAQTQLLEAKAAKEQSIIKLNEAKARDANEKAAQREAAAIEKSNKAKQSKGNPEIVASVQHTDDAVDFDAIDQRNEALRQQQIAEAEAAGSTGIYADSQQAATAAIKAQTSAIDLQLDALEQNIVVRDQLKSDIVSLTKENKTHADSLKAGKITQDQYNKSIASNGVEIAQYKERVSQLDREIKDQASSIKKGSDAYQQLAASTAVAKLNAKNLAAQYGLNHPLSVQASADALKLDAQLKKIDKSAGDSFKNVGNYGSAFTKVFSSLRTAAAILPGIGIAGILGAISGAVISVVGNLFKSVNAFNEAKEAARSYAAVVKEVNDKQISGSAGDVAKLELYRSILTDVTRSTIERTEALHAYNSVADSSNQLDISQINNLNLVNDAISKQITLIEKRAFSRAAESILGDKAEKLLKAQEDARLKAEKDQKNEEALTAQQLDGAVQSFEIQGKTVKITETAIALQRKQEVDRKIAADEKVKAAKIDFDTSKAYLYGLVQVEGFVAGQTADKNQKARKETQDDFKFRLGLLIEFAKAEVAVYSGQDKINARIKQNELEKELITGVSDFEINQQGVTSDQIAAITHKREHDLKIGLINRNIDIERFAIQERQTLLAEADKTSEELAKRQAEIDSKELVAKQAHINALHDIEEAETTNGFNKAIVELDQQFAKKEIKEKEYNARKLRLQAQLNIELLNLQITYAEAQLAIDLVAAQKSNDPAAIDKVRKQQELIAALKIKVQEIAANFIIGSNKKIESSLDRFIRKFEKISSLALQLGTAIGNIFLATTENDKNKIQDEIDLLEQKKEKDIEVANSTIANAQDRAAAITVIEARSAAQKAQLDQRQRQLDERRARFEKAQRIVSIIGDTAQAVMKTYAQSGFFGGLAGAIAVGVIGGVELAAAIATPIPKYKMGTKDHPGGPAEVGHGKAELVEQPDGKMFVTPSTPTVINIPEHSIVHPDAELAIRMGRGSAKAIVFDKNSNGEMAALSQHIQSLERNLIAAIKNKTENHFHAPSGLDLIMRKTGDHQAEYLKRNLG